MLVDLWLMFWCENFPDALLNCSELIISEEVCTNTPPKMTFEQLLEDTRRLINTAEFKDALKLLKKHPEYSNEVRVLQEYGEIYLEMGKVDKAFDKFSQAIELDPQGEQGAEKFLYLGQIIGDIKGLELIDKGITILAKEDPINVKKINQSIFAEIEIWMTDLCMLPEAETRCNELIEQALQLDGDNAETWSLLANIRISQQRDEEAVEAIQKSWYLFKQKKESLEQEAGFQAEYLELLQPLLTLAKIGIELGLYELCMEILSESRDIDEDNAECYYLEGFTNYLYIKKSQYFQLHTEFDVDEFERFGLQGVDGFDENAQLAKLAFENVLKLTQVHEVDPEIISQTEQLLGQLAGVELAPEEDITEDNWEAALDQ